MVSHARTASQIKWQHDEKTREAFAKAIPVRNALEYASGELLIRQPVSVDEITAEGRLLHHCVGGYAERHALGKLHILFIRKKSEPDVPYYTMEVSESGEIIQVRGLKNCQPTEDVKRIVDAYKEYIKPIFGKEARKTA